MDKFAQQVAQTRDLTEEEQKKAGTPVAGSTDEEHRNFLNTLKALIDAGEVDPYDKNTFLNEDVYAGLNEEWREKSDLALINMQSQVSRLYDFMQDPNTPDESPQLDTMVEGLWQMKQQIEEHHDVFKF